MVIRRIIRGGISEAGIFDEIMQPGLGSSIELEVDVDAWQRDRDQAEADSTAWQERAACKGTDPSLFFPVGKTGPSSVEIQVAKKVCNQCVVLEECLGYALATNQSDGIWGGTSEDERQIIKRRRR